MRNGRIILSVATTGSWAAKSHNPSLPIAPEEIASAALEGWREGAAIVHVHGRDDSGRMS